MLARALAVASVSAALLTPAAAAQQVGTSLPPDFPVITDASLHVPVIGFGSPGPVTRVPVILLHGNNDTPYPTSCNGGFGHIHDFAQYLADHGYAPSELWGLGYQGDQCDLVSSPTNKSGEAHSTLANVPDLRAFVHAVLDYTGARQVDIIGHSLGTTLAREWMRQDDAYATVRTLVGVDGPNHGIINCSPSQQNYFKADAAGGFGPDSAICREYGSDRTPLLARLNAGDETPAPTRYAMIVNADKSFVYFSSQDGVFPAVPAEDRDGRPHDFSRSARLEGAETFELVDQGRYDNALLASHTGIVNSPEAWRIALGVLEAPVPAAPPPGPGPAAPPAAAPRPRPGGRPAPRLTVRVRPRRDRRAPYRFRLSGRLVRPAGVTRARACRGVVSIQARRGRRTLATRTARVGHGCRWHAVLALGRHRGRIVLSVRFFGNAILRGAAARPVRARAGPAQAADHARWSRAGT